MRRTFQFRRNRAGVSSGVPSLGFGQRPFFVTKHPELNHSCRTSAWSARRSSSDSRFHSFLSTVDQRLHVKQPFRRSPPLSISISGCLHWLQQAILSASMTARSALCEPWARCHPYRQLACARFCHSATFSAPVFQSSSMVSKHFSQSAINISVAPGSARAYGGDFASLAYI